MKHADETGRWTDRISLLSIHFMHYIQRTHKKSQIIRNNENLDWTATILLLISHFFLIWPQKHIKFWECLLLFGSKTFVFLSPIWKCKYQNIQNCNFTWWFCKGV